MRRKDRLSNLAHRLRSNRLELPAVSVAYLLVAAILTYPTILRLDSHIPGFGDAPGGVWDIWAFARAMTDPQGDLRTTDLVYHPLPDVPTIWGGIPNLLLSLPLEGAFGPVVMYNVLFLCSFVLSGLFTYLLAKHLSGNKMASFVAGAIFSFSAYHYAHGLVHHNLLCIHWLPLCVLSLLRLYEDPGLGRSVGLGVAMSLVVLSSPYYAGYFLVPLLICFFFYHLWKERARLLGPRFLASLLLALGMAAIGVLFFYPHLLFPGKEMAEVIQQATGDTERYSADLLAFVIPSRSHPVFGSVVARIYDNFTAPENVAEMTVYVGYVTLLLSIWGLVRKRGADAPFWAVLAVVAFIISLGPVLHVNGQALFPLPYALLMKLPFFGALRAPSRASVTVMISLSVLAAYGLRDLLERVRGRARIAMVSVVVPLICFETLFSFPHLSSPAAAPGFYQTLADRSQDGALFELPSGAKMESVAWYMLYQSYHHKRLATGYLARTPLPIAWFPRLVLRGDLLSPPVELSESENWPALEAVFGDLLAYNDIRYVIAHRQSGPFAPSYSGEEYRRVKGFLRRSLGEAIYEDEGLVAHEVSSRTAVARASFSGELELIDHRLVEATSCPDGASGCTFLVTFWRAVGPVGEKYGFYLKVLPEGSGRVVADAAHNLGHQYGTAVYNTTWWAPGVVIADYILLPSVDLEGNPLSAGTFDIKFWVGVAEREVKLSTESDYYTIDEKGWLLIDSYTSSP